MVIKDKIKFFITDLKIFSSKNTNNKDSKTKIGEIDMFFDGRCMVNLVMSLVKSMT